MMKLLRNPIERRQMLPLHIVLDCRFLDAPRDYICQDGGPVEGEFGERERERESEIEILGWKE